MLDLISASKGFETAAAISHLIYPICRGMKGTLPHKEIALKCLEFAVIRAFCR